MKKIILLPIFLLYISSVSFGTCFSAFNDITTSFNISPTFSITPNPLSGEIELPVGIPLLKNVDLWVNLSTIAFSDSVISWEGIWVMPRYNIGSLGILPYNIIAIELAYPLNVSLQYHTELSIVSEVFSIEANIIGNLYQTLSLSTIIAPVLYLTKLVNLPLAIYLELDTNFGDFSSIENSIIAGVLIELSENLELNLCYNFIGSINGWLSINF
ncbi:MAG: hypothetical protein ACK4F9_02180 [Brevinematia bacterium]